jgi:mono/diheme cytochrome c family protein
MFLKRFAILVASTAMLSAPSLAEDQTPIVSGEDEFMWNCAECHGFGGRGDGPLAEVLIKKPTDLTQIAKNNVGVFPADTIFAMIAGRENVVGHQSFQMPRFWQRFQQTEGERGFDKPEVRIKAIVDYLGTIQAP